MNSTKTNGTVLYIPHGGGPLPLLGDPAHATLVSGLKEISSSITKPDAIVVISAHWEADRPTITSSTQPNLLYDYYGFPPAAYEIQYPCPGEPELANKISKLLRDQGIDSRLDPERGLDHGVFVPLKIMYPDASIPCVQLSLVAGLDPEEHIRIGQALRSLLDENVLVVGSGFSFHNMQVFMSASSPETQKLNEAFENWLMQTCTDPNLYENQREQELINWAKAPAARFCHPREEHLLPLHVCYGLASRAANQAFQFDVLGIKASAYLW